MKEFKLTKGGQVYDAADIEDEALRFTVQLLVGWVLRKCRPTKVPATVVDLAAQEKDGKPYNWCLYLLNQFMEDCTGAQEHNQPLHYSWMLVLLTFVMWKETKHNTFLPVWNDCRGVRYVNLWATADSDRQRLNNMVFYTYYQQLCVLIADKLRITKQVTDLYNKKVKFTMDLHRIYIKPRGVKRVDWYNDAY